MGQTGFHKENDRLFFKARRRRKFLMIWGAEYQDSCIFGQGMKGFRRLPSEGRAGQRRAGQGRNLKRRAGRPVCPALKGRDKETMLFTRIKVDDIEVQNWSGLIVETKINSN